MARKPPLTAKVLRGLVTMAGRIEIGDSQDAVGVGEDELHLPQNTGARHRWHDLLAAVQWVRETQRTVVLETSEANRSERP